MYGRGIAKEGEILDAAVELGIIQKSGSWFSYKEERLGQGRDNVKNYILEHPDFMDDLEKQIKEQEKELTEKSKAKASYRGGNMHATAEEAKEADEKSKPAAKRKATSTAAAKAQLDITVDDDE